MMLKNLVAKGYLESDNKGRWTLYKISEERNTITEKVTISKQKVTTSDKFIENEGYMMGKVDTSIQKVDTSGQKVTTSDKSTENEEGIKGKVDTSEQKVTTSKQKVTTSETEDNPLRKRYTKEELEKEIMRLCKTEYRKKEELAALLGKSADYLKTRYIYRMQKEGKLKAKFPYTPNHFDQAYKTNEDRAAEL